MGGERERASDIFVVSQTLTSVQAMLISLCVLPYLAVFYPPFGVHVLVVERMLKDVKVFSILCVTFLFATTVLFIGLSRAGLYPGADEYSLFHTEGAAWVSLWALYGQMSPDQHSATSGIALFFVTMVTNVALVNLLVALFADTYADVAKLAKQENSLAFHYTLFRHSQVHSKMPPPLNAPYVLWYLGKRLCKPLRARCRLPLSSRAASVKLHTPPSSSTADDKLECCDRVGYQQRDQKLVEAYVREKEEKEARENAHVIEHGVALSTALEALREMDTRVERVDTKLTFVMAHHTELGAGAGAARATAEQPAITAGEDATAARAERDAAVASAMAAARQEVEARGEMEVRMDARIAGLDHKLDLLLTALDRGGRGAKEREPALPSSSPRPASML